MMFNYCGKYQERFIRFNDFIYIFNNILRGIFCIEGKGWLSYACSLEFIYFSRAILKRWEVINYSVIYLSHQFQVFIKFCNFFFILSRLSRKKINFIDYSTCYSFPVMHHSHSICNIHYIRQMMIYLLSKMIFLYNFFDLLFK